MSGEGSADGHIWLTLETVHEVADRLAEGGVADPSPSQVAAALGVQDDVVLAVLAATSRDRLSSRGEEELVLPPAEPSDAPAGGWADRY